MSTLIPRLLTMITAIALACGVAAQEHQLGETDFMASAMAGMHTFRGDYAKLGDFSGTVSNHYSVGIGKWVVPAFGIKIEASYGDYRGYTPYEDDACRCGMAMRTADGQEYWKMKTQVWDASGWLLWDLTRIAHPRRASMYRLTLGVGLGMVHHLNYRGQGISSNELAAHAALQYSRFIGDSKRISVDARISADFYPSSFDLEHGQFDYRAQRVDWAIGVSVGVTAYFGRRSQPSQSAQSSGMAEARPVRQQSISKGATYQNLSVELDFGSGAEPELSLAPGAIATMVHIEGEATDPAVERAKEWVRRHPQLSAATVLVYGASQLGGKVRLNINFMH